MKLDKASPLSAGCYLIETIPVEQGCELKEKHGVKNSKRQTK